jgi:hypothetical protein
MGVRHVLVVPLLVCAACVPSRARSGAVAIPAASNDAVHDGAELPRLLSAELGPREGSGAGDGNGAAADDDASFASGRLRLEVQRDGSVEYRMSVYNPGLETITAAHVLRAQGNDAGTPVVTLFSSATMRDRYLDVRGTALVLELDGAALLEEMRRSPSSFFVNVRSTARPGGTLRGTMH